MEASVMSKSVSGKGTASSDVLKDQKKGIIDSVFPLFDALTKKGKCPWWIQWFVEIWSLFQTCLIAMWLQNRRIWKNDDICSTITDYLSYFRRMEATRTELIVSSGIVFGMSLVILIVCGFQIIYYSRNREFLQQTLLPTRFVLEIIPSIIMYPISRNFGDFLYQIENGHATSLIYVLATLMLLCYILNIIVTCFGRGVLNASVYLASSPFSTFRPDYHSSYTCVNSIVLILAEVFRIFPEFCEAILVLVHSALLCFLAYKMYDYSFVQWTTTVTITSVIETNVILDIVNIILWISEIQITPRNILISYISIFASFCLVSCLVIRMEINKIRKDLAYDFAVNVHDTEHK
jgi:hypothetical protein